MDQVSRQKYGIYKNVFQLDFNKITESVRIFNFN